MKNVKNQGDSLRGQTGRTEGANLATALPAIFARIVTEVQGGRG